MADIVSRFTASNVHVWSDANVYIAPLTATDPAPGAPFGTDWQLVGALDGSDGFNFDRSSDQKKFYGWGTGVLAVTDKNYEESVSFTALEDNAVVRSIIYPGSTYTTDAATGTTTADLKVPRSAKIKIAFELGNAADGERYISANYAQLDGWPSMKMGEEDLAAKQIKVAVIANSDKTIWRYQLVLGGTVVTPAPTTP